jgi:hypothetical protein
VVSHVLDRISLQEGGPAGSAARELHAATKELQSKCNQKGVGVTDLGIFDWGPLGGRDDGGPSKEKEDLGGGILTETGVLAEDKLHAHGRRTRPYYYIPDRDTGRLPLPLRAESMEPVSPMDIQKRLWKSAAKGQTALLRVPVPSIVRNDFARIKVALYNVDWHSVTARALPPVLCHLQLVNDPRRGCSPV